jgi:hypothetical protein
MKEKKLSFTPEQFNTVINGILFRFAQHIGIKDQEVIKELEEFGKKMDDLLTQKAKEKNEKSI